MLDIERGEINRARVEHGATEVGFRIRPPSNTGILKQLYQMLVCG